MLFRVEVSVVVFCKIRIFGFYIVNSRVVRVFFIKVGFFRFGDIIVFAFLFRYLYFRFFLKFIYINRVIFLFKGEEEAMFRGFRIKFLVSIFVF